MREGYTAPLCNKRSGARHVVWLGYVRTALGINQCYFYKLQDKHGYTLWSKLPKLLRFSLWTF